MGISSIQYRYEEYERMEVEVSGNEGIFMRRGEMELLEIQGA